MRTPRDEQARRTARVPLAALLAAAMLLPAAGPLLGPWGAQALSGGPDAFGYAFFDSSEPAGPVFDFQDVSATGSPIFLGDDQVSGTVPLGFTFSFYGNPFSNVFVSSNGFITFTATGDNGCCSGEPLPSGSVPGNVISAYWEDFNPGAGGSIRFQTLGSSPGRVFILQFTNVPHFGGGAAATYQYKLFESSNVIQVHYVSAPSDGGTHSAGIQRDATTGLQYRLGSFSLAGIAVAYAAGTGPDIPLLTGPASAIQGDDVPFEVTATDPEGRDVAYQLNFGDGSPAVRVPATGFVPGGTTLPATHAFAAVGSLTVIATAVNTDGFVSGPASLPIEITNDPPSTPLVNGPSSASVGTQVAIDATATDPEDRGVAYLVDWGDGTAPDRVPAGGFAASGSTLPAFHTYERLGTFGIEVTAVDPGGQVSALTELVIQIVNDPPLAPDLAGAPVGTTLLDVEVRVVAEEPNGEPVAYTLDWGDGTVERVPGAGFLPPGEDRFARHRYAAPGTYAIGAVARDIHGGASAPSDPLAVEVLL